MMYPGLPYFDALDMDYNAPFSRVPNQSYWVDLAQKELEEGATNPIQGIHTVICVDISASISQGSAWEQTQQFFDEFITGLEEARLESDINVENVALSVFGGEVKVVQRLTTNYTLVKQAFSALQLGGPSPLVGGLLMALAGMSNPSVATCNGIRILPQIILITDGHPTDSLMLSGPDVYHSEPMEQVAVLVAMSTNVLKIIRLHCVPVGNADLPFLEKISAQSQGKLFSYKDGRMLARRTICTFRAGHVINSWKKLNDVSKPYGIQLSLEDAMKSNLQISSSSVEEQEHILQIAREALETNLENEGKTELDMDHYEIDDPDVNLLSLGTRVRRGPDWNKGSQDDPGSGTVICHHKDQKQVKVEWDKSRHKDFYRYGDMGQYDVLIDNEPRVLQSELIATGCHVRRGGHWMYGNQDGTPGAKGIVLAVKEDGIVVVRWPNKSKYYYRCGAQGCFDLEICDPVENPAKSQKNSMTHPECPLEQEPFFTQMQSNLQISSSSVEEQENILRITREALETNLGNKGKTELDTNHYEIDDPDNNLPSLGTRVRRGPDWNKGSKDDHGSGTVVGHHKDQKQVKVEWDKSRHLDFYRYGDMGQYDVLIDNEPRVLQSELIATGCHVRRGGHWKYGNQDGTLGAIGIVLAVKEDGIVVVRWPNTSKNYYRYGAEGCFDLEICDLVENPAKSQKSSATHPECPLEQEPFITQEAQIQQNSIQKYHNESQKLPPLGTRVRRGVAWDKGQQDGDGPGTIVGHNEQHNQVYVEWDRNRQRYFYCFNDMERSEVVVVDEPRRLQPWELIVTGCHVKQGKDCMYGNDNDTMAVTGVVLNVREDGMVLVRWPNKSKSYYRYGAEGQFDLEICDPHNIHVESHIPKILSHNPNLDQSSTKQVPTEKGRDKNKVLKKKGRPEASSISIHDRTNESNMIRKMSGAHVKDQRTSSSTTMSSAPITTEEIQSTMPHETTSTVTEVPTTNTISNIPSKSATTEVPTTRTKITTQPPMTTSTAAAFAMPTRTEADTTDTDREDKSTASTSSATKTTTELLTTTSNITLANTSTNDTPTTTNVLVGFDRIKNIFYKKEDVLGLGCNGTVVYRGKFDERDVAVKRLLKEHFSLADKEVKLLRESDDHPNVIRYFWMEEDINFLFIALDLCEGTLHDYVEGKLKNMKNIDPVELLRQSLSGLAHLHSLGIVHRDLKPQNILISKPSVQGEVRAMISDFGFSKKLERKMFSSRSKVLGTEGWIAPEMLQSGQKRTIAVDIFSAGCMMHYVLAKGLHPFGEDATEIQYNIRQGKFNLDRLPVTSDGFIAKDIIEKMLSGEPRTRPTAKAVLNHLLFWKKTEKLQFLEAASDWIVVKMVPKLEQDEDKIVRDDWKKHLSKELLKDITKDYKEKGIRYSGFSVKDLLRMIRNKRHHYNKMPEDVRKSLGSLPDEYLDYFTSRFPLLLLHTYHAMECCAKEDTFRAYYKTE